MKWIVLLLVLFAAPVLAVETIESQNLENCEINDKIVRYSKITNCRITNSEIYSAEIVDSQISNSNVHEVDVRHSVIEGGNLRNIYTTGGSVIRNAEVWTSTIEGTYVDHSSGGQVTIREGDVDNSNFSGASVNNAGVTDSNFEQSTTNNVDVRTRPAQISVQTSTNTSVDARDVAIKAGIVDEEAIAIENSTDEEYVITDDRPESRSGIQAENNSRRSIWKAIFCWPPFKIFISC